MSNTMRAAVIHEAGGPEVLKIEERPIPTAKEGWVLIRVHAFGLNRSEMFTRQGHSINAGVTFPRILGIEATGTVVSAPGSESQFKKDSIVMTAMGGMGRLFDGGYAEYTLVPTNQVQVITGPGASLGWDVLGALPEMFQTAYGALHKSLQLKDGERLLVRGGTTSVGLAALGLAKAKGCFVASTTRRKEQEGLLREYGADEVVIDDGKVSEQIKNGAVGGGKGYDKCLELVGTVTLHDSMRCVREGGTVCMAGIVGNKWTLENFSPMELIPTATYCTMYGGGPKEFMATPLNQIADDIAEGKFKVAIGKVLKLDQIVEAHELMESNNAGGKIVVLTS